MNISILGAGAWGTALAHALSSMHPKQPEVLLWARDEALLTTLKSSHCNSTYLPNINLSSRLLLTHHLHEAFNHANQGLLIIATALSGLAPICKALSQYVETGGTFQSPHVVWLCKGIQSTESATTHSNALPEYLFPQQIAQKILGNKFALGMLSGPSFAQEVAQGLPAALVAASNDLTLQHRMVDTLHGGNLRIYPSSDITGVAVGGAVKNVLAIATGICDGLSLGLNARAALMTRGLAEMQRFNLALGGSADTIYGLAGMGDLLLTCTGDLSRNRRVGLLLAQGLSLNDILIRLGHVAEGVRCAAALQALAQQFGVTMPIVDQVNQVLFQGISPRDAVANLMQRALPNL